MWALQKVYLKKYFLFHLFFSIKKQWLRSAVFDQTSFGGDRRRYYQKNIQNSHWQDTCEKKCYLLILSKFDSTCCFTCWKRNTFQISIKFHLKKKKIIFVTLFSPTFDVLHSWPIVHMDRTELIFQDLLLYCTKNVCRKSQ